MMNALFIFRCEGCGGRCFILIEAPGHLELDRVATLPECTFMHDGLPYCEGNAHWRLLGTAQKCPSNSECLRMRMSLGCLLAED